MKRTPTERSSIRSEPSGQALKIRMSTYPLRTNRGQRGAAMIITLSVLLLMSLLAMISFESSETEKDITGNMTKRTQAFLAAEAGMAQAESVLGSHPNLTDPDTLLALINADPMLPNAQFSVSMDSTLPARRIISVGTSRPGGVSGIQVTYRRARNPHNIWNNAIFAGHGQNSRSIRGNVDIHGSVHILGNGERFTDANNNGVWDAGEPFTDANHDGTYDGPLTADSIALSMGGTAYLGNNYTGMSAGLRAHVPDPPTVTYRGETVETLEASLRVMNGTVFLDGDATVGQPDVAGGTPALKETVDAVYVSDGFTGSAGSSAVFSDNGSNNTYDLQGDVLMMPDLDDPFRDPSGTMYPTYMAYLKANALVIPGDLRIKKGEVISLVASGKGSLSLDADGNLTATGTIYVEGNIDIKSPDSIFYDGSFTLVSEGNVQLDADLLPKGKFATDDVAGVVSYGTMTLGAERSHISLAGAFYAQEEVTVAKQTQVAGSLVSNYFGALQVPDVYQVPALVDHLPPNLPGTDNVYVYLWQRVPSSWTELD